jgi:cation diffusion facilitator family transporter
MYVPPSSDPASWEAPDQARLRAVTWLGVGLNVALGLVKVGVGWIGHSRALVADGLHSLSDLASDAAVLFGLSVAARPPDASHPYGHHKAASLVTLGIGAAIVVFCLAVGIDAIRGLQSGDARVPHLPTLGVALASLAVKEFLYRRTRRVGEETGSRLILANAWHHRTDSVSSLVAAAGIGAAIWLGPEWAFLDALAGILLAAWLGVEGVRLLRSAVDDLMDAAPGQALVDDLREHILPVEGAVAYHDFRARRVGDRVEVDFHLLVPPELNVEEAHGVARRVKRDMLARHPEVLSVLIHVEPALPEHHRERGYTGGSLDAPPEAG